MASTPPTSSLPAPPNPLAHAHDRLTALPPELLQQISSYLYAAHSPDQALNVLDDHHAGVPFKPQVPRDLANFARASKCLYQQTNAWAHLFLHTHRDITKYRIYKTAKAAARQNVESPLQKLLQWSARNCVFCGKTSARSAILVNGLRCCRACDREQWPEKITETAARKQYKLFKHRCPMQGSSLRREVPRMKLRYGTYFCMGVCTTMYLRKDVEAFVEAAMKEGFNPVADKKTRRHERVEALKGRKKMPIVSDDDGEGDAVEVVKDGGDRGAVFQKPIVIDDD